MQRAEPWCYSCARTTTYVHTHGHGAPCHEVMGSPGCAGSVSPFLPPLLFSSTTALVAQDTVMASSRGTTSSSPCSFVAAHSPSGMVGSMAGAAALLLWQHPPYHHVSMGGEDKQCCRNFPQPPLCRWRGDSRLNTAISQLFWWCESPCCMWDLWWLPVPPAPGMVPHTTSPLFPVNGNSPLEPRAGSGTYTTAACGHLLLV